MNHYSVSVIALVAIVCLTLTDARPQATNNRWNWTESSEEENQSRPIQPNQPNQPSTQPIPNNPNPPSTTPTPQFATCLRSCQTTNEYNPVCGTNRQTYENEARLNCAVRCGITDLTVLFKGTCRPVT